MTDFSPREGPKLSIGEKLVHYVLAPICALYLGITIVDYTYEVALIPSVILTILWAITTGGVYRSGISRLSVNSATPLSTNFRDDIEEVARAYGVTFRGVWELTSETPPWRLRILGVLPRRLDLYVDADWFASLSADGKRTAIVYNIIRSVRRKHRFVQYTILSITTTALLVFHLATVRGSALSEWWLRNVPLLLGVGGIALLVGFSRWNTYRIDAITADKTSPEPVIQYIESIPIRGKYRWIRKLEQMVLTPSTRKRKRKLREREG